MSSVTAEGIVLRTYRLGEADRIVVVMTEDAGKVRGVAKGVRKTGSRSGVRLETLTHASIQFWKGRSELWTVSQAQSRSHFRHIRADLDRLNAALSLVEVIDKLTEDHHQDPALFAMLLGALRALDSTDAPYQLVAPAFFLKVLAHDGALPFLDSCVSCASPGPLEAIDFGEGGVLCHDCRRGRPISPGALNTMRAILGGQLRGVLEDPSPAGADEVVILAAEAMEFHLDRRLRSLRSTAYPQREAP